MILASFSYSLEFCCGSEHDKICSGNIGFPTSIPLEGRIEMMRIRRRPSQLLDDLETRGHVKLKDETLDLALWRTLFELKNE